MYRQAVALSVGLCLFRPLAWPQEPSSALTVDQLVSAALAKNRDVRAVAVRLEEARGLLKQAGVGIADNLEIGGLSAQTFGRSGEDSIAVTYSHTFETFRKRGRRVQVAEREIALAQAELAERQRTLIYDIKTHYADVAAEQQKLAAIDCQSTINGNYLRLTETRVEKGDAAPLEADLLRVELSRDQSQRILTEGRTRSALLQLQSILDNPQTDNASISRSLAVPSFTNDLPALKALAIRTRPDLRSLQIAAEQAEAQTALAKVETTPNLTLSGQYSHADTAFDQFGLTPVGAITSIRDHVDSLGLTLSVPLTTARRNRGNLEAAVARQAGAKLRGEYLANAISAQVEAAYQHWRSATQAAAIFSQGVMGQSEKNLTIMRQAYELGELRLIDILNEQRRLLDTQLSYVDTQADVFRAYAELEHVVGGSL